MISSFCIGDIPRRVSYCVYISQLIRFARVCNHLNSQTSPAGLSVFLSSLYVPNCQLSFSHLGFWSAVKLLSARWLLKGN